MNTKELQLSEFIKSKQFTTPLSINERSFQIFGDEKFLNSTEGKSLLNKNHISIHMLNVYKTPEPFIYYLNPYSNSKNALIIENKDSWYTMKYILKNYGSICGINIKALIYGEGRKIQNSFSFIEEDDTADIHDIQTFYYFGDIDASGIDIYYKLKNLFKVHNICPFEPGYEYLYNNRNLKRKKEMKNNTRIPCYELSHFVFLGVEARVELLEICNNDFIIPQEILNYEVLQRWNITSDYNDMLL